MTHFRVKYSTQGVSLTPSLKQVHARFFSANRLDTAYETNGELHFSNEEWNNFRKCFTDYGKNTIVFIPNKETLTCS